MKVSLVCKSNELDGMLGGCEKRADVPKYEARGLEESSSAF